MEKTTHWNFVKVFYLHNWRARMRALWNVLTQPAFVVLTCKDQESLSCQYNVQYKTYHVMHELIKPRYQAHEAKAELNKQLDDILEQAKREEGV